jgi:hypothetical protein
MHQSSLLLKIEYIRRVWKKNKGALGRIFFIPAFRWFIPARAPVFAEQPCMLGTKEMAANYILGVSGY